VSKFYRKGISRVYFLPVVANTTTGPTRSEITAGTRLLGIAGMSGFQLTNSPIDVPDMDDRFVPKIPGDDTVADCTITFNDDTVAPAWRASLAKDVVGYIYLMPYGDVPTKRAELWPGTSTGVNDEWDATGTTPAKAVIGWSPSVRPAQNLTVPASA
jgi:hypothetical protein